jgi:cytochrome c peroxidase
MNRPIALLALLSILGSGCFTGPAEEPFSDDASTSFMTSANKSDGKHGAYDLWSVVLTSNLLGLDELDGDVGLDARAAASIIDYRAGVDKALGTADDRFILDAAALDDLYFVGPDAYRRMEEFAAARGWDSPDGLRLLLELLLDHVGGESGRTHFVLPEEGDLSAIPQDPNNPLTAEKVHLGKLLFHDRSLAQNPKIPGNEDTYSCASCHHAAGGFGSGSVQGFGEGGVGFGLRGEGRLVDPNFEHDQVDAQPVKTPPALNLNWQPVTLTSGKLGGVGPNLGTDHLWKPNTPTAFNALGHLGVETQAIAGLAAHRLIDDAYPENTERSSISTNPEYNALFEAAFPDETDPQGLNQLSIGLAIAAYERTIMAQRAPFQRFLRGERQALTDPEVRGALVFFGDAGCVGCHSGPALNSMAFFNMGFRDMDQLDPNDAFFSPADIIQQPESEANLGRASFTGSDADRFAFKVPQLYNLRDHVSYGHGGTFTSVREVIDHMNAGRIANSRTNDGPNALQVLGMSEAACADLEAFISDGLHDPDLQRFVPTDVPSRLCGINGDPQSTSDFGCQ